MLCSGHIDTFDNFVSMLCCDLSVDFPSNSVIENNRQVHKAIDHEEEHSSPVSDNDWNFPEQEYRLSYNSSLRGSKYNDELDSLIR